MEFIIYRDSWRRGGDGVTTVAREGQFEVVFKLDAVYGITKLYNSGTNMQCCLGQIAYQGGVPLDRLDGVGEPCSLPDDFANKLESAGLAYPEEDDYTSLRNSNLADECMPINDRGEMTDAEREAAIIKAFEDDGTEHTIKFVDGVAPWFLL